MPRNDEEEGEGLVDDELRSPPPVLLVPVAKGDTHCLKKSLVGLWLGFTFQGSLKCHRRNTIIFCRDFENLR